MSETEQEQQQSGRRTFPLDWHFPEDVQITSLKITGSFPDGKRLTRPLEVKVAYDDGEVVMSESLFHIHGVGTTLPQALVAFKRVLAEELDELTADEEELGPRLEAELHYLRDLMRMAEIGNISSTTIKKSKLPERCFPKVQSILWGLTE